MLLCFPNPHPGHGIESIHHLQRHRYRYPAPSYGLLREGSYAKYRIDGGVALSEAMLAILFASSCIILLFRIIVVIAKIS